MQFLYDGENLAVVEQGQLVEWHTPQTLMVGDIVCGEVAAIHKEIGGLFVHCGQERNGFLPTQNHYAIGQRIILQVEQAPHGEKGAKLTERVTLVGRYVIYTPYTTYFGQSKKMPKVDIDLRKIFPVNCHGVLRTEGVSVQKSVLQAEAAALLVDWQRMQTGEIGVLHHENLLTVTIRDRLKEGRQLLVTKACERTKTYMIKYGRDISQLVEDNQCMRYYQAQIQKVHAQKVWLPCGGMLVVESTQVCTTIDVNTAKCVQVDAIDVVNAQAVAQIVKQIRLKQIVGLVLVDFIGDQPPLTLIEAHFQTFAKTPSGLVELLIKKGKSRLGF